MLRRVFREIKEELSEGFIYVSENLKALYNSLSKREWIIVLTSSISIMIGLSILIKLWWVYLLSIN